MMTWALSLVAIIAMSDRTLLTSHARCWIVGSLPYLLCHLTTCASGPGPDGFQAEYLKITLKAQNLELGKDVITEIARYATAFGAGLLPAHTYYAWGQRRVTCRFPSAEGCDI